MTTEAAIDPAPDRAPEDDFDAAKAIFEKLKGVPLDRQERILRWVCESLGIALPAARQRDRLPPPPPDEEPAPDASSGQTPTDIKTFIASKRPKSDMQFVAAVAYYYRFVAKPHERKDTINAESLQEASRQARGSALHKPAVTINNAIKAGYLDRTERGAYRINTVGENLVAMTLPGDGKERPTRQARPSRKRAPTKKR